MKSSRIVGSPNHVLNAQFQLRKTHTDLEACQGGGAILIILDDL